MADNVNVQIAKKLGWTVRQEISTDDMDRGMDYYSLFAPDGKQVMWYEGGITIAATWNEDEAWSHAPDFEHSLDAVAAVLKERNASMALYFRSKAALIWDYDRPQPRVFESAIDGVDIEANAANALLAMLEGET